MFFGKTKNFLFGDFLKQPSPGNAWCDPPVVQLAGAGMLTLLVWAYKESAAEVVRPLVAPLTVEAGTQHWPHIGISGYVYSSSDHCYDPDT